MRARIVVVTLLLLASHAARAQDVTPPFKPDAWATGFHMLAGGGVNTSAYNSDRSHVDYGLGTNFKADVGYYITDRWAVEVGSDVKFNWSDGYLIWDTLFTVGARYRFESPVFHNEATFVRAFVGRAPTVVFLDNAGSPYKNIGASRIQFDGPVVGIGGGRFHINDSGFVWFFEWDVAYQWLHQQDVIKDNNDVPVVIQSGTVNDNSKIFSAFLNVGFLVF